jgi:HEAT repeat protein/energy-coupling factor transporter ATP-binding protein EcfA2
MSEPTNHNTGSQGNQGQQGNVAGANYGVQKTETHNHYGEFGSREQRVMTCAEWQEICRGMLERQMQLTSNTVLRRVYGNRNLIDEDLFVDLALVKPKRSQNEKHPQEIDPEKGSDLYNREEVEKRFAYREFLQEVISKRTEKRLAIIGEPGAGKTTLLQKLAFWLLQETDDLVVWVSLAELGSQPLGEYLEQKWLKEALGLSREEIKADWRKKFDKGAVWLLLDGLDEMSQTDLQGLKFRGWVTDARMIVTCRLNLWQANPSQLQGFQTYLTQPFQDEQMQEFIRRWFRGLVAAGEDIQLAESLWSELQESGKERIKDLCRNPLRLTLLCATWKVEDALPETMADLYGGFVESVYGWKETAFPVTEEEKEQLNAALGELAKASLEAETSRFRLTHRLVCEYLGKPKAKGSLFPLALKLGWLNEVGVAAENPREKVYGFYHATFQEYFAALAVEDWDYFLPKDHGDRPVAGKRYRIFEKQWKQVILLWLGREDIEDEEKEGFIRALVEFKDGCGEWKFEKVDRGVYEYHAYFLAGAVIDELKDFYLSNKIVRQLVKWSFGYFNIKQKKWFTILPAIEKKSRNAIKESIIEISVLEMIDIIKSFSDFNNKFNIPTRVIRDLLFWLGELGSKNINAINILIKFSQKTIKEELRHQAAYSLGYLDKGNQYAITTLIDLICTTDDDLCRFFASRSLGQITKGDMKEINSLLDISQNIYQEWIKLEAASTLLASDLSSKDISQEYTKCIAILSELATSKNEDIREQAIRGLENAQGNSEAISTLLHILERTQDEKSQRLAAKSLVKAAQGNSEAISTLLHILKNTEDVKTQWCAVWILGKIAQKNPEAILALEILMNTSDNELVCDVAAESLRKIKLEDSDAIESQPKIITTPKENVRAISALKENLTNEVYQNDFDRFDECYKLIWNCAENLSYPEFYQAWHNPPTTPHPEVTEQTPHSDEQTFASPLTWESLQHLPMYCLNADLLADETREREIALTVSELIWEITCPEEDPPEPATPAELRRHLKTLKRRNLLPHGAILFGGERFSTPTKPTPELIVFCQKLTAVIAIAFLTDESLEAPLKGFPPNQPNLISAIETWLEEI